mmetsp:Transcript_32274/g.104263  ORF Transcript_32274/g.104263 Transcript_32274/m.104263 type:complete len:200 (+) Transcript_32274:380-979(+)
MSGTGRMRSWLARAVSPRLPSRALRPRRGTRRARRGWRRRGGSSTRCRMSSLPADSSRLLSSTTPSVCPRRAAPPSRSPSRRLRGRRTDGSSSRTRPTGPPDETLPLLTTGEVPRATTCQTPAYGSPASTLPTPPSVPSAGASLAPAIAPRTSTLSSGCALRGCRRSASCSAPSRWIWSRGFTGCRCRMESWTQTQAST